MMSADGEIFERQNCEMQYHNFLLCSVRNMESYSMKPQLAHNFKIRKALSSGEIFTSFLTECCIESFKVKEPIDCICSSSFV